MRTSPLTSSVDRFGAAHPHADVGCGDPGTAEGWFRYEALCEQELSEKILQRIAREYETTPQVSGTYTFRAAHYLPIAMAGFLFALELRVPRLHHNLALLDRGYLNGFRLLRPLAVVLETDPAAGTPGLETAASMEALADSLFAEVAYTVDPVLTSFRSRRLVAEANAWGILIDFLAYGFLAAGRAGLGLDAAWDAWNRTIAGRSFPIRRRPRRLQFDVEGKPDEIMVRSHCCLYYTLPQAKKAEYPHCVSCYLESDECRIERLLPRRTS